ncbi:MAG: hypothetical protein JW701_04945, partial [Kosmotogaceae bacterium]|nr:hypothetical protein [Kosmotogaceae bacterium]
MFRRTKRDQEKASHASRGQSPPAASLCFAKASSASRGRNRLAKETLHAGRWKESKAPKNIGGRRAAFGRRRSESQSRFAW